MPSTALRALKSFIVRKAAADQIRMRGVDGEDLSLDCRDESKVDLGRKRLKLLQELRELPTVLTRHRLAKDGLCPQHPLDQEGPLQRFVNAVGCKLGCDTKMVKCLAASEGYVDVMGHGKDRGKRDDHE
jgi:hypothetical protein